MIFNLDHEMETLHFISNGEDPYPTMVVTVEAIILNLIITYYYMFGTKRGRERKEKKKKYTCFKKRGKSRPNKPNHQIQIKTNYQINLMWIEVF